MFGGQRVLLLSISRFLCTVPDNKTLYMPNKVCVLFISLGEISQGIISNVDNDEGTIQCRESLSEITRQR